MAIKGLICPKCNMIDKFEVRESSFAGKNKLDITLICANCFYMPELKVKIIQGQKELCKEA
jgi:hypothetical protein